jgi:hypothetical protein
MPPDELKYFNRIKTKIKYLVFRKSKKIQDLSNNLHVMCV